MAPLATTISTREVAPLRAPLRAWLGARLPLLLLAVVLLFVLPLVLDAFRISLVAKYLSFAFAAVGVVLIWGYGGILSLGQGIFFGLGSYAMAMFLKLEAASQDSSASALSQFYGSTLPDFMVWNSIEKLPWWWQPFHSLPLTLVAIVVVPAAVAYALAYANFKKRVGSVYFSIVTLALASILSIVIIGQQGYTGGINGITDFKTFAGIVLDAPSTKLWLYFTTVVLLLGAVAIGQFVIGTRLGKVLVAVRDREDRVRFSGYDPALFKAFVFTIAAVMTAIGGALFTLHEGLASPSLVGIVPSIEIVIYAAVGGRLSMVGAVYGTLVVFGAKTFFSENFVDYWLYLIGAIFIGVTMFMPAGLAGVLEQLRARIGRRQP
jgi:urea transport system permease protein